MRPNVRGIVVGVVLVVAIAGASLTAVLFSGGSSDPSGRDRVDAAATTRSTSTSTTTSTSTSTTTTTAPPAPPEAAPSAPAPPPAPAPAPEAPAPAPAPSGFSGPSCDGGGGGTAGAIVASMNADRAGSGLGSLCWNGQLGGIAESWANWMAANQSMQHQDLGSVLYSTPFSTMGENLLVGPVGMTAGGMENTWMNSGPHRANILGNFSAVGVGIAAGADGQWYVAVEFAG